MLLYVCDTYNSLTISGSVTAGAIVNIDRTFEKKMEALRKHRSQPIEHFGEMARRQAEMWGARIGCRWAEAFDAVPVLGIVGARHTLL
jgi:threonine aldolase